MPKLPPVSLTTGQPQERHVHSAPVLPPPSATRPVLHLPAHLSGVHRSAPVLRKH